MNPRRLTPSMSLLLAFEASARHLSFTRAGAELALTQSAVSRQVQSLEGLLGVPLFMRESRRLTLTAAGDRYHQEIYAALQRIRGASLQALSYRSGGGSLQLAVLPTFAAKWLMPRMGDFYKKHPGILVHIHSRIQHFNLNLAGVDAVIGVGDGERDGLTAHHLVREYVVPVIGADESLAGEGDGLPVGKAGKVGMEALDGVLLLQVASRPASWQRWFEAQGQTSQDLRIGPQFELTSHLIQAVASGIGAGLLPTFLVKEEVERGLLRQLDVAPFTTGYSYNLYVPHDKKDFPPVAIFTDWLLSSLHAEQAAALAAAAGHQP